MERHSGGPAAAFACAMAQVVFDGPFVHDNAERVSQPASSAARTENQGRDNARALRAAQVEAVVQEEANGIVTVANGNTTTHAMPCHPSFLCFDSRWTS